LAGQLGVAWNPPVSSNEIHGMMEDSIIFVFDIDEEEALKTLRHEFLEFVLTEEYLNPKIFEAKAYRRADAFIDIIARMV